MAPYHPDGGYMQYRIIQDYYKRLTQDPLEDVVGHLWHNILSGYFSVREGFALEVQPRPAPRVTKQSNDVTVRYVKHIKQDIKTPLTLIAKNHVSEESKTVAWTDAVNQLTEYMKLARMNSTAPNEDMYGIVTVGHYSRFYVLHTDAPALADHPRTGGAALEFAKHEATIVELLLDIKTKALSPSPAGSQTRPGSSGDARPDFSGRQGR
ncbi:hypothetical protein C8A03DRAFT_33206 [Achaetomium macrosporum]|uniref:Uncharacterized protein n=1 Tax=Achaetomium macrosporum TaxID=79813 RepID=A0AAN7CB13_9PEZI|nr:hypothetical protein C8A03DRAFT_33206 [Achaetomium macrosporum]